MPGFKRLKEIVETHTLSGSERYFTWRKTPSQVTTIGIWFDLSMSPGNPVPKYWFDAVPLNATQVKQSTDGGIFHGSAVSPKTLYLREAMVISNVVTALPMPMILCDYLLYYPTIDEGTKDTQTMTNIASLPRYTDGKGVQMMAVSIAGRTGGQSFTVNYTNSDGISGRISKTVAENSVSVIGSVATSDRVLLNQTAAFIGLQDGDSGVRSIESVTMNGIDVGLFTLLLVKPIAQLSIIGIDAPVEIDYFKNFGQMPEIYDDAYLNFLCLPRGSLAATTLIGSIKLVFN